MFQTALLEWMKIENTPKDDGPERPPSPFVQKFLREHEND